MQNKINACFCIASVRFGHHGKQGTQYIQFFQKKNCPHLRLIGSHILKCTAYLKQNDMLRILLQHVYHSELREHYLQFFNTDTQNILQFVPTLYKHMNMERNINFNLRLCTTNMFKCLVSVVRKYQESQVKSRQIFTFRTHIM